MKKIISNHSIKISSKQKSYLILSLIALLALLVRLHFYAGQVFSDDSYYSQLAYSLSNGSYGFDYTGYPIFLLRKLGTILTATSFTILGTNEFASVFVPLLFSIAGIIVIYKFAELITGRTDIALIAAYLLAFFPTDIQFATINFADLQCALFINLGLYYTYKAHKYEMTKYSIMGGAFLAMSIFLKENVYYSLILLGILWIWQIKRNENRQKYILTSLISFGAILFLETVFYLVTKGDWFYRFTILKENYIYCYYDFFPYTLIGAEFSTWEYLKALGEQIFLLNPKYLFLRRFYLFLPLLAAVQSYLSFKKRESRLLIYWFIGIAILMIGFTTSFTDFKPLDLRRNWYIFTILPPVIILSAIFINKQKEKLKYFLLSVYTIGSIFMCYEYTEFFDLDNKREFKNYISAHPGKQIFTDHHTKYGIDLVDRYSEPLRTNIIDKSEVNKIGKGDLVVISQNVLKELKFQGHDYSFLIDGKIPLQKIEEFGEYIIFEKNL